jgi:putative transcriptional regulator
MTRMWSRRAFPGIGVVLLAPALLSRGWAKPADSQRDESLAGQLLVATPEMNDPRFRQTVILMVQHDPKGALGIAINRPVKELPIRQLLDTLHLDSRGSEGSVRLFAGGPVQTQVGFIIHSAEYRRSGTVDIDGRVAMTRDPEVLRDIGRHRGPQQSLIAFGYAGWGPGQLEGELAIGGWFTVPEEPGLVFDIDREKLWDEATKRRTISL